MKYNGDFDLKMQEYLCSRKEKMPSFQSDKRNCFRLNLPVLSVTFSFLFTVLPKVMKMPRKHEGHSYAPGT